MYGAIIVEPPDLSPAREYVLVASEFYPGKRPVAGVFEGDLDVMGQADPPYVVFDGGFNRYLDAPLEAKPGEPIRLWVMNAGPTLTNAFHVIGALFDHVYPDGNPTTPQNGLQTYNVPRARARCSSSRSRRGAVSVRHALLRLHGARIGRRDQGRG